MVLAQHQLRATISIGQGLYRIRQAERTRAVEFLTNVYQNLLTRRGVVGYTRYRGAAAHAIARARGIRYGSLDGILNVPRYGTIAPPAGLARALAEAQVI